MRIKDILLAIQRISSYMPNERDFFDTNDLLKYYIPKHLEIVGEAAFKVSAGYKENHSEIPWAKIIGMTHILVRDYFKADWDIIWNTARNDILPLRQQIQKLVIEIESHGDTSFPAW